jgi:hypothetical protein
MSDPMKAAVFICRGMGRNLMAYAASRRTPGRSFRDSAELLFRGREGTQIQCIC